MADTTYQAGLDRAAGEQAQILKQSAPQGTAAKISQMQQQMVQSASPVARSTENSRISGGLTAQQSEALKGADYQINNPTAPIVVSTSSQAHQDLVNKAIDLAGKQNDIAAQNELRKQLNPAGTTTGTTTGATTGTETGTGTTGTTTGTETGTPSTGSFNDQLNSLNAQSDAAYASYKQSMDQLQSGTFPLTPDQQAQIDATKASFDRIAAQQKIANQNYTSGMTQAGITSGRARYAPEIAMGEIQGSITSGLAKIADIEAKASAAVAQLKEGFRKDDFDMINSQYDKLNSYLDKKQSAIMNMAKMVQDHEDKMMQYNLDVQREMETERHNQIDEQLSQQSQNLTSAKNAFDEKVATANALGYWINPDGTKVPTETAIKDAETQYNDAQNRALTQARLTLDQQKEAFSEQQAKDPLGLNGSPQSISGLVDAGIASSLTNGKTYLDISQFSDSKQKAQAEKMAREAGIPIVSSVAEMTGLTKADTGIKNLEYLRNLWAQVAPKDAGARLGDIMTNWAKKGLDTPEGQFVKAYQDFITTQAPALVQSVGGVNRVTGQEMQAFSNALPSLDPHNMDTVGSANLKFDHLNQALNNSIDSILKNKSVYSNPTDYYSNASQAQKDYFNQVRIKFPDWSPDDVLQFIQARDSGGNFSQESQTSSKGTSGLTSSNPNSSKVIAGYDFTTYATDPNWGRGVSSNLARIPDMSSPDQITSFIQKEAPGSPITGDMVMASSTKYGVDPKIMLAIMKQEANYGTLGRAARTFNPGNVGNVDSGANVNWGSWEKGMDALAHNVSRRRLS